MAQLSAELAADPGDQVLVVMTYYNHLSGTGSPYEATDAAVLLGLDGGIDCNAPQREWGLNDIIACVGTRYGATVADVYPAFVGKGPTLTHVREGGDFHPTNAGYAIIANTFMHAIQ